MPCKTLWRVAGLAVISFLTALVKRSAGLVVVSPFSTASYTWLADSSCFALNKITNSRNRNRNVASDDAKRDTQRSGAITMMGVAGEEQGVTDQDRGLGVGFDFGTSGVRAVVIDIAGEAQFDSALSWAAPDDPDEWLRAADTLMGDIPLALRKRMSRVCVSGTSASCLLVDTHDPSRVTRGPRMYGYNTLTDTPELAREALLRLGHIAPDKHTTLSGTSALMKLVCWHLESPVQTNEAFCHQADYVSAHIRGARGPGSMVSDWNNALKAGFDVETLGWPSWLLESDVGEELQHCLPKAAMPGAAVGAVSTAMAFRFGLPSSCQVVAGTTDSIAAFIAANATTPGHAVTSLGSTLAIKMLSERRVEDASRGVYSHRLGDARRRAAGAEAGEGGGAGGGSRAASAGLWLVGGASNVGCAVLRMEGYVSGELETLSAKIDPATDSPWDKYYPLPRGTKGERFPTNDPSKESVLDPRPEDRGEHLHGLLQAIARVEKEGYATLESLGATKLARVDTAGGGAVNPTWTKMRQRLLGVPTGKAGNTDAAYGCALLAMQGLLPPITTDGTSIGGVANTTLFPASTTPMQEEAIRSRRA